VFSLGYFSFHKQIEVTRPSGRNRRLGDWLSPELQKPPDSGVRRLHPGYSLLVVNQR
jgi:hypothetical protein